MIAKHIAMRCVRKSHFGQLAGKDFAQSAAAGAIGAVAAEMGAEAFLGHYTQWTQEVDVEAARQGIDKGIDAYFGLLQDKIELKNEYAKLSAGLVTLLAGQDVEIGVETASNAVKHNILPCALAYATAKILWEVYVLTHPDEIETAKETICQFIADKSGLNIESVRKVGDLVMTGTSLTSMSRQVVNKGAQHLARKAARESSKSATEQLNAYLANHRHEGGQKPKGTSHGSQPEKSNQNNNQTSQRVQNLSKAESSVWKELKPYRENIKTNGLEGKKKEFYQWDHLHNEIEVYDSNLKPVDALDLKTGNRLYKDVKHHRDLKL